MGLVNITTLRLKTSPYLFAPLLTIYTLTISTLRSSAGIRLRSSRLSRFVRFRLMSYIDTALSGLTTMVAYRSWLATLILCYPVIYFTRFRTPKPFSPLRVIHFPVPGQKSIKQFRPSTIRCAPPFFSVKGISAFVRYSALCSRLFALLFWLCSRSALYVSDNSSLNLHHLQSG